MKEPTRSAKLELDDMKRRLASLQRSAFERGMNYGVLMAMKGFGVDVLRVTTDDLEAMSKAGLKVVEHNEVRGDDGNVAWEYKIV